MKVIYILLDFVIVFAVFALIAFLIHLIQTRTIRKRSFEKTKIKEFRNPTIYKEAREAMEKTAPTNSSFYEEDAINIANIASAPEPRSNSENGLLTARLGRGSDEYMEEVAQIQNIQNMQNDLNFVQTMNNANNGMF